MTNILITSPAHSQSNRFNRMYKWWMNELRSELMGYCYNGREINKLGKSYWDPIFVKYREDNMYRRGETPDYIRDYFASLYKAMSKTCPAIW